MWGYFGTQEIGNVTQIVPHPLQLKEITNIANNVQQNDIFYENIWSDTVYKEIEGSILNTSLKKLRINCNDYEWGDPEGLISNDLPTMTYLLLTRINPVNSVGVLDIKENIDKDKLSKFGKKHQRYSRWNVV